MIQRIHGAAKVTLATTTPIIRIGSSQKNGGGLNRCGVCERRAQGSPAVADDHGVRELLDRLLIRKVGEQGRQVVDVAGAGRLLAAFLELRLGDPAGHEMIAECGHGLVALGITDPDLTAGRRNGLGSSSRRKGLGWSSLMTCPACRSRRRVVCRVVVGEDRVERLAQLDQCLAGLLLLVGVPAARICQSAAPTWPSSGFRLLSSSAGAASSPPREQRPPLRALRRTRDLRRSA